MSKRPAPDLSSLPGLTTASAIESMLRNEDLPRVLACSDRTILRLRAAGKFPPPDLLIGTGKRKSPRWKAETIRRWIDQGGEHAKS